METDGFGLLPKDISDSNTLQLPESEVVSIFFDTTGDSADAQGLVSLLTICWLVSKGHSAARGILI